MWDNLNSLNAKVNNINEQIKQHPKKESESSEKARMLASEPSIPEIRPPSSSDSLLNRSMANGDLLAKTHEPDNPIVPQRTHINPTLNTH